MDYSECGKIETGKTRFRRNVIPLERASQKEQNSANFSFSAQSSHEVVRTSGVSSTWQVILTLGSSEGLVGVEPGRLAGWAGGGGVLWAITTSTLSMSAT